VYGNEGRCSRFPEKLKGDAGQEVMSVRNCGGEKGRLLWIKKYVSLSYLAGSS